LFYGNATVNPNEFDGAEQLIAANAPGNVVLGGGDAIDEDEINDAIQTVVDNGGMVDIMYLGARTLRDWADLWANKVVYNDPTGGMQTGYNLRSYMSFAGPVEIIHDHFINATNSPSAPGQDVFLFNSMDLALAESEPMYRLPTYRGLTLAETQTVVWNCVFEMKIPQWQSQVQNTL
jgi:hypothetical protein